MKKFELCVVVSYKAGDETYYNSFKEYVNASNEKEALEALAEMLDGEGYETINVYEIH